MARLSNSAMETWFTCGQMYGHRYETGWTASTPASYFQFGQRMHSLLQAHHSGQEPVPPPTDLAPGLENEAQAMLEGYKAAYPVEDFSVVACEKGFDIAVGDHRYVGRLDMVVRCDLDSKLLLLETKTESRGSRRNTPQAWTARHQGSLYSFAASQVFGEPVDSIILNVLTRGSEKQQVGPGFRRDLLHRSPQQIKRALEDFHYVADRIDAISKEAVAWPQNTSECVNERGYACTYYSLCHTGSTDGLITIEPYSYLSLT